MTRVVVSTLAASDLDQILDPLQREAGAKTALRYAKRFSQVIERLGHFPLHAPARPALGVDTRIYMIYPYLIIYDFVAADDRVVLLRILHGKRDMSERILKRS